MQDRRTHNADVFRAVADPTRRALLDLLRLQELPVSDLRARFRMSQPAISQHLGVLRRAKLVRSRRQGRRHVYRLNPKPMRAVFQWVASYRTFFDPAGHAWAFRRHEVEN